MSLRFSRRSLLNLHTLTLNLQLVLRETLNLNLMDFAVVCGFRDEEEQNKLYIKGLSRVMWPNGKHNSVPSKAADIYPFVRGKISFDLRHCIYLAGLVQAVGKKHGVEIRWGGNWDMDGEPITDQDFQDLGHFEEVD